MTGSSLLIGKPVEPRLLHDLEQALGKGADGM